jgi:uncharacterized membrane protein YfcA
VLWPTVAWLTPGLLAGGVLGALLAGVLPDLYLRFGVAGFCWLAAWRLATAPSSAYGADGAVPHGPSLSLFGVGIGVISALVGIGGGSMTVPLPDPSWRHAGAGGGELGRVRLRDRAVERARFRLRGKRRGRLAGL